MNALDRVFYFHELVRKDHFPNEATIQTTFGVSESTAKKDIAYLRDRLLAPLTFNEEAGGYQYTSMFRLPFESHPRFIFFMSLVHQMIRDSGLEQLPEIEIVMDKIQSLVPESYRNVLNAIRTESVEVEYVDPDILNQIIEALHLNQSVDFAYYSLKKERSERRVDPWRLFNYQGKWYLIGYCHQRKEKRSFHCGRMRKLKPSGQTRSVQPPSNLDSLEQGFGVFKGEKTFEVKVKFSGEAATIVKYQVWHGEQMIESVPGGILLTLPVADEREIMMKIMQYGSLAEVLEPQSLAEKIHREASKIVNRYESNQLNEKGEEPT